MEVDNRGDLVLAELRKLREGPGATPARLAASGAVMSALGTSDPTVAVGRLRDAVASLGDTEPARALSVDFGLDLERLLGRAPVSRELQWLGDRRSGYSEVVQRDTKTLGRWSDKAIGDLRGGLLADTFTGHLYVVAAVKDGVTKGISMIQEALEQPSGLVTRRSSDFENPSTAPSLPALIYGYPRDWRPASLTLAVSFSGKARPRDIWAVVADNFFNLLFAQERHELRVNDDTATCRFERLRTDRLYAIFWRE